ncbi:hypothetical protein HN011_010756 [Eciton burchellii]|nr:hypothetical protein HN011_010756 [Eciton burchellii]
MGNVSRALVGSLFQARARRDPESNFLEDFPRGVHAARRKLNRTLSLSLSRTHVWTVRARVANSRLSKRQPPNAPVFAKGANGYTRMGWVKRKKEAAGVCRLADWVRRVARGRRVGNGKWGAPSVGVPGCRCYVADYDCVRSGKAPTVLRFLLASRSPSVFAHDHTSRRSARLYVLPRITPKKGNLSSRFVLAC